MPIMEISVVPVGTCSTSMSDYIAASEKAIQKKKSLRSQINAMETIVESDSLSELFATAKKMHKNVIRAGARRVITSIKIDDRLDKKNRHSC